MNWHRICCCRCCFSRRPGLTRIVEATVSRCTLEDLTFVSTFFYFLCTKLVIFHGRLGRFETPIIEVLFLFAQLLTPIHDVSEFMWDTLEHSMMVLVRKMIKNSFSQLFIGVNPQPFCEWLYQFWLLCSSSCFIDHLLKFVHSSFIWVIYTLEIALANIIGMHLYFWMWRMSTNAAKWTFLAICFCAFFMTSFHSFFTIAFASGINVAWSGRSSVHSSRFPEACVSERQISRVFWTIHNSRFPKFAEQDNSRSSYLFPDFQGYSKNVVSQVRCAARRDNVRLFSPLRKIGWRASLRSLHRNELVRKVVIQSRIQFFPWNINTTEFGFASDVLAFPILIQVVQPHVNGRHLTFMFVNPLPDCIFLPGVVSLHNVNLVK